MTIEAQDAKLKCVVPELRGSMVVCWPMAELRSNCSRVERV